jgi:hypothetical protein
MDSLRGKLIIAAPTLVDPNFARTVVLIAEHTEEGAMGLVLNRPAETLVDEAVPDLGWLARDDERVWVGGPVAETAVIVLAEWDEPTLAGAIVEGTASQVMQRRLGDLAAPYHSGTCGRLSRVAKTLTTAGALATCFGGRRDRRVRLAGGAAAVAGAALERWAVFRAGFQSARDPKYTVEPQLERAGERRSSQR